MICPKCNQELLCPCESCNNNPKNLCYALDSDILSCPCGFSEHIDWWEELEMAQDFTERKSEN